MRKTLGWMLTAALLIARTALAESSATDVAASGAPIDLVRYEALMAERVTSPAALADWFHDLQFLWWPLALPSPEYIVRQPSDAVLPFDWQQFPDSFNRELRPHDLCSVPAYRVTLVEDSATRQLIVYNELDQPILFIPPEPGYDASEYVLARVPDLNSGRYGPESREYFTRLYDPANSNSKPVSVSGTVTYGGVETGLPIRVLAVTASNSWAVGRSVTLQAPGAYTNDRVATLLSYWFKAFVDVNRSRTREDWEPAGLYSNASMYVTNNRTGVNIVIGDVPSVWGTLTYTGQLTEGTVRALAATTSNGWTAAYAMNTHWRLTPYVDPFTGQTVNGSLFPSNYTVSGLSASNYYLKGFLDVDGNGALAAPEPAGYWTNNPVAVTCRVTNVNILLDRDSDGDGLPDWWELDNFGNLAQSGGGDADGDGASNLAEYRQGRDPNRGATAESGDGATVRLLVYTPME